MCGRCAILTSKPCLLKIAGLEKPNGRNVEGIQDRYNLGPYDTRAQIPVIHNLNSVSSVAQTSSMSSGVTNVTESASSSSAIVDSITQSANSNVSENNLNSLSLSGMRWGLVPSFAKDAKQTLNTFNCRSDRLVSSGMWKRLVLAPKSRCILVIQGYFEWGAVKRPRFIQLRKDFKGFTLNDNNDNSESEDPQSLNNSRPFPFLVAGLYDHFTGFGFSPSVPLQSCSMVTVDCPNPSDPVCGKGCEKLRSVHDRMPLLLLDKESCKRWLNEDYTNPNSNMNQNSEYGSLSQYSRFEKELLLPLEKKMKENLAQYPNSSFFDIYEVDKKLVGSSRNDCPECLMDARAYAKQQILKNFGPGVMAAAAAKAKAKATAKVNASAKANNNVVNSTGSGMIHSSSSTSAAATGGSSSSGTVTISNTASSVTANVGGGIPTVGEKVGSPTTTSNKRPMETQTSSGQETRDEGSKSPKRVKTEVLPAVGVKSEEVQNLESKNSKPSRGEVIELSDSE